MLNKHISDFLDDYAQLNSPQYALLLKGKWGSGKTYYVDQKKLITKEQKKYKGKLKGHHIENFIKYGLTKAIADLEKYLIREAQREAANTQ